EVDATLEERADGRERPGGPLLRRVGPRRRGVGLVDDRAERIVDGDRAVAADRRESSQAGAVPLVSLDEAERADVGEVADDQKVADGVRAVEAPVSVEGDFVLEEPEARG